MPTFTVEAIDAKGKKVLVSVEGSNSADAVTKVKAKGMKPMNVKEKAEAAPPPAKEKEKAQAHDGGGAASAMGGGPPVGVAPKAKKASFFMGRVRHAQLTQFTQQLSVLMDAGLP